MKWLPVVIIIAVLGGLGYQYRDQIRQRIESLQSGSATTAPTTASSTPAPAEAITTAPPAPEEPPKPKLDLVPGKFFTPTGTFYITERVSISTDDGIAAFNVADKVTLVEKLPGDRMKVTDGKTTGVIKSTQATNDLVLAREAEKKDFVARGGKL